MLKYDTENKIRFVRLILNGVYKFGYTLYALQIFHDEAKIVPKVQYFIVQGYSKGRIVKIAVRPFFYVIPIDIFRLLVQYFF